MSYFFHGCRGSFSYRKFLTKQFIFIALCNLHTDLDVFCIISEILILFHCTDVSFSHFTIQCKSCRDFYETESVYDVKCFAGVNMQLHYLIYNVRHNMRQL